MLNHGETFRSCLSGSVDQSELPQLQHGSEPLSCIILYKLVFYISVSYTHLTLPTTPYV